MSRAASGDDGEVRAASAPARRAPYLAPRLVSLGSAAIVTNAVMMRGLMDGFMQRRTG
jgi:hypothetical protein